MYKDTRSCTPLADTLYHGFGHVKASPVKGMNFATDQSVRNEEDSSPCNSISVAVTKFPTPITMQLHIKPSLLVLYQLPLPRMNV